MQMEDPRQLALSLIQRYGTRAQAIAGERVAELQNSGDATEFEKWRQIQGLIGELRRTERTQAAAVH